MHKLFVAILLFVLFVTAGCQTLVNKKPAQKSCSVQGAQPIMVISEDKNK